MAVRKSASRIAAPNAVNPGELAVLGQVGTGSGPSPAYELGPYATQNATYKNAAQNAATDKLRFVVLSDSTSDSFSGGRTGAGNLTSTAWKDTWPYRFARKMRTQLGLPSGGVGWIPPSTPSPPAGYAYRPTEVSPANWNTIDDLTFNQGIPGSMWLQRGRVEGSAIYIDTATYTLTPGTTSVDLYISAYGANIEILTSNGSQNYQSSGSGDERRWLRITNPGSQIQLRAGTNSGFALFGLIEHAGDEIAGVEMMNMAIAGIRGDEVYGWLQDPTKSLKPAIARQQPHVAFVILGSNDIGFGRTPQDTLNTLGGIALELRNAATNVQVIFVMRENPDTNYQQLVTLVKQNAASVGATVLDLGLEPRLDLTAPGIYITDNQHYTDVGDEMMATVMAEHMKVQKPAAALNETQVQALIDASQKVRRWASEVIINSGALANGYNDNIGGILVDYDVTLYQASFRLSDPAAVIGGTGNLQIQWYAGNPTALETTLIATTQVAAGQHDVIVTFATPVELTINTVLRAKITMGSTTVTVPCHVQWRGRYK